MSLPPDQAPSDPASEQQLLARFTDPLRVYSFSSLIRPSISLAVDDITQDTDLVTRKGCEVDREGTTCCLAWERPLNFPKAREKY